NKCVFFFNSDSFLNFKEFQALTRALFCNEDGKPYKVDDKRVEEMFAIFDTNKDKKIDFNEFKVCWNEWIKQILSPVSALLVIDVQNDFISGSLSLKNCAAKQDGNDIIPVVNSLLDSVPFDLVVYTYDWHPSNHVSFFENIEMRKLDKSNKVKMADAKVLDTVIFEGPPVNEQILWPAHCIQGSWGAKLHPDLKVVDKAVEIYKGVNPDVDSYSAFWDNRKMSETKLLKELRDRNITDVYVCGLAFDVCVAHTAFHAIEHGFRTTLIDDACRGVSEEGVERTVARVKQNYGVVTTSEKVYSMVLAKDRRPELGYQAALQVAAKLVH
uniref:nicotinamidase n=1 Tax=Strigamia maritima TaxID=126957 RepID=T1JPC2_STRMM